VLGRRQTIPSGLLVDERARILRVLDEHRWNRERAAAALGISRVTLWRRMERHGIRDPLASPPRASPSACCNRGTTIARRWTRSGGTPPARCPPSARSRGGVCRIGRGCWSSLAGRRLPPSPSARSPCIRKQRAAHLPHHHQQRSRQRRPGAAGSAGRAVA
jgi:hypothetical protein